MTSPELTSAGGLHVTVLGPLAVTRRGERVDLGPARQRAVLALLAMAPNEVVSVDRLVDQLWSGEPPASAVGTLQAYVSNLRRALEPDRPARLPAQVLATEPPGYVLRIDRAAIDSLAFEDDLRSAREQHSVGRAGPALAAVERALRRWSGSALADYEHDDFTQAWRARLDELRAGAEELRVDLLLAAGRATLASADLEALIERWPLRERFRAQQVLAMAASGRQADALRAYDRARRYLGDELGIDPGPDLEAAYQRVLHQDPLLLAARPSEPAGAAGTTAQPDAAARRSDPFVGRHADIERALATSRPGFVVISGEAGIGKTRLAEELLATAAERGSVVAIGRCHDDEGAPPLWPWHQITAELGIAGQAGFEGAPDDADRSDDMFRRFEMVRRALEERAARDPVVVLLDDVQWADLTSLRLLSFLATERRAARVLVVVTVRDTDVVPGSPVAQALARLARRDATQVEVRGLAVDEIGSLAEAIVGDALDPERCADLLERTGGNAFFVSEVARLWASEGSSDRLPPRVGDVVRARLTRLPDATRNTLAMAAALGRSFDLEVLARAVGRDLDELLEGLDSAVANRVLVESGPGRLRFAHAIVAETILADLTGVRAGRLHLRAADALGAARATVPGIALAEVARQLDHVVRTLGPAYAARAVEAALAAADEAAAGGAFADSASWTETALRHAEAAEVDDRRRVSMYTRLALARFDMGERDGAAKAQHEGIELSRRVPPPERAVALAEACTLAIRRPRPWQWRPVDDVDPLVVEALEQAIAELEPEEVGCAVRARCSLAIEVLATAAGPARGDALTLDAIALARPTGDPMLLAQALLTRVLVRDVHGGRPDQLEAVEEVLAMDPAALAPVLRGLAVTWRIAIRAALAEGPIGYDPYSRELRAIATSSFDPSLRLTRTWGAVTVFFAAAKFEAAHERALEAYRAQRARGEVGALSLWLGHEGVMRREQGTLPRDPYELMLEPPTEADHAAVRIFEIRTASARGDREAARRLVEERVERLLARHNYAWLVQVGRLLEGAAMCDSPWTRTLYEAMLPYAGEVILRWPYANHMAVDFYLGLGARALGRPEAALAHFGEAIRLHEAIEHIPYAMRSRVERAQTLADVGRWPDALAALDEIDARLVEHRLVDLAQRSRAIRDAAATPPR